MAVATAWSEALKGFAGPSTPSITPNLPQTLIDIARAKLILRHYFSSLFSTNDEHGSSSGEQVREALQFLDQNGHSTHVAQAFTAIKAGANQLQDEVSKAGLLELPGAVRRLAATLEEAILKLQRICSSDEQRQRLMPLLRYELSSSLEAQLGQRSATLRHLRAWVRAAFTDRRVEIQALRDDLWDLGLGPVLAFAVEEAARSTLTEMVDGTIGLDGTPNTLIAPPSADEDERLIQADRDAVVAMLKSRGNGDDDDGMTEATDEPGDLGFEVEARPVLVGYIEQRLLAAIKWWMGGHSPIPNDLTIKFTYAVDCLLLKGRSSQLFDLITDWPSSKPAVLDLKTALEETGKRLDIGYKLSHSLHRRLLHPGAKTREILQIYVSLVYTIRCIDPSGILLSRVAGPVRSYLRSRSDTVPVIVASLLGDDEAFDQLRGELDAAAQQNESGGNQADVSINAGGEKDDEEEDEDGAFHLMPTTGSTGASQLKIVDYSDPNWEPRPIDAGPSYRQTRSADVIAMLVSIFDAKASFIKALEISTARALLKRDRYEVTREYRNNEVLKRRFGDASLARCDVMLQDVADSKRTDGLIRGLYQTPVDQLTSPTKKKLLPRKDKIGGKTSLAEMGPALKALKPLITSRHFWPDLEGTEVPIVAAPSSTAAGNSGSSTDKPPAALASIGPPPGGLDLKLPGSLGKALEDYNRAFTAIRESRRLRWLPGFGRIRVSVEMKDGRSWNEVVDPIKAAILIALGEQQQQQQGEEEPLCQADLAKAMNLESATKLDEAFGYWCSRNVLVQVAGRAGCYVECYMTMKEGM